MKKLLHLIARPRLCLLAGLSAVALGVGGCNSASTSVTQTRQIVRELPLPIRELGIKVGIREIAEPVLDRNPDAAPALEELAAGIDALFARGGTSRERVNAYVADLAQRHGLDRDEADALAAGVELLWQRFAERTGRDGWLATDDPEFAAYMRAAARGIREALADHAAATPIAPAT